MSLNYGSTPILATAPTELAMLASQTEAELYDTPVYRKVLAQLQQQMGAAAESAQVLIESVARTAIQLTLKKVTVCQGSQETEAESELPGQQSSSTKAIASINFSAPKASRSGNNSLRGFGSKRQSGKKLSLAEAKARATARRKKTWARVVREIGREIQEVRQERSLSLYQLHLQTLVPSYHLEALENGWLDRLPEDIYIRGFIRRIGDVLGLDGARMAASLPVLEPINSVLPPWAREESRSPISNSGISIPPIYLYLGYATLLAGAVGTVGWLSERSQPEALVQPEPGISTPTPDSQVGNTGDRKPGSIIGQDIAPPEVLP